MNPECAWLNSETQSKIVLATAATVLTRYEHHKSVLVHISRSILAAIAGKLCATFH